MPTDIPAPRRAVAALIAAIAIVGANSLSLTAIAIVVAADFPGADAADVMAANAAYGAGVAVAALLLARQADRIGLKRALIWSLGALAATLALSAAAPSLATLIAAQAAAGLAAGVALPAAYGLAAEIALPGEESATLGATLIGWTFGMAVGVGAAAAIADAVGWRWVYGVLAICAAATALFVAQAQALRNRAGAAGPWPHVALRIRGVPAGLLLCLSYMVAFYGSYAYLGPHLTDALGLSPLIAGAAAIVYGVGFGAAAALDPLLDRHGPRRVTPIVFGALSAVYVAFAAAAGSGAAVVALCAAWGVVNHLAVNLIVGQLAAIDPDRRATILGLYSATAYGAMAAGVAAFKLVFALGGWSLCALLAALCVGAGGLAAGRRRPATG